MVRFHAAIVSVYVFNRLRELMLQIQSANLHTAKDKKGAIMSEWKCVEYFPPPRDGRDLLMTDGESVHVCYPKRFPRPTSGLVPFDENGNIISKPGDVWEYFRDDKIAPGHSWRMVPTHWMEIPELPTKGTK